MLCMSDLRKCIWNWKQTGICVISKHRFMFKGEVFRRRRLWRIRAEPYSVWRNPQCTPTTVSCYVNTEVLSVYLYTVWSKSKLRGGMESIWQRNTGYLYKKVWESGLQVDYEFLVSHSWVIYWITTISSSSETLVYCVWLLLQLHNFISHCEAKT
jgi:hypothetical protein